MTNNNIVVLKFGSSVLRSRSDLPRVVHEIYRHWRNGSPVVAIASAFGDTTNRLFQLAEDVSPEAKHPAIATLVATGEAASAALLTITLDRAGIPAKLLDPAQAGLRTVGDEFDSEPLAINAATIQKYLRDAVVILPGFLGRNGRGDTTLLGRGGSDLSAVFVAQQLGARCILIKDVDGLYSSDPATTKAESLVRFNEARYETASHVGKQIVQPKAIQFAAERGVPVEITTIGSTSETIIGSEVDVVENARPQPRKLRVALLGCGVVGGGVYARLAALPNFFEVIGVAVRDVRRKRDPRVPKRLLTTDADALVRRDCDVVVELIGGILQPAELVRTALRLGRDVVTANKALIAAEGDQLEALASEFDVSIRASAAVGGALPALELVRRARSTSNIAGFAGVLNGTTNFILDALAKGKEFKDAVRAAQEAGYAEADPSQDIDGTDAARKLILLAREAFGISLPLSEISRQGIEHLNAASLGEARKRGCAIRLVAKCSRDNGEVRASVAPVEVPVSSPFGRLKGADNALMLETTDRNAWVVCGAGAGRWPTTESVMADLFDLHREFAAAQSLDVELEEVVA
jgi:homoserine dehydrogenase